MLRRGTRVFTRGRCAVLAGHLRVKADSLEIRFAKTVGTAGKRKPHTPEINPGCGVQFCFGEIVRSSVGPERLGAGPVHLYCCQVNPIALRWGEIPLSALEIKVRRTW